MKPTPGVLVLPCAFAFAIVMVAPAAAEPLPEPPRGNYTGAARTVAKFLDLYYGYAQDPDFCILSMRSAESSFARNGDTIHQLEGPEAAALADYFDHQLVPYFAPQLVGVPGFGTYDEVVARREAAATWIRANLPPKTPIASVADVERYAAAENTFLERVTAERAWTAALFAAGPCIRHFAKRSFEHPTLGDFGVYQHWISERSIAEMVVPIRGQAWPKVDAHGRGANTLKNFIKGPFPTMSSLGTQLLSVASDVKAIDDQADAAALLKLLGERLRYSAAEPIATLLSQRAEIRAQLAAWFAANLPKMGLPAADSDGAAATQAKAWTKKAGKVLAVRVTQRMTAFDTRSSEVGGRFYNPPVRFKGKSFTFHVVRPGVPWPDGWPRDLGVDPAQICNVQGFSGTRYEQGMDVTLGKWRFDFDSAYPIRCADKDHTYQP